MAAESGDRRAYVEAFAIYVVGMASFGLVLRYGLTLAAAGLGLGLIGSVALTRLLVTLLYGISPTDPVTLGAMGALLVGVALLACYLPALRATRVDPMVALRYE